MIFTALYFYTKAFNLFKKIFLRNGLLEWPTIYKVFQQARYKNRATGIANDAIFLAALLTFLFSKVCHFIMAAYTSQQRVETFKIYYRNSASVASTLRALRSIYGRNNRPSSSTIERLVEKFESTGTVENVAVPVRQRSAR